MHGFYSCDARCQRGQLRRAEFGNRFDGAAGRAFFKIGGVPEHVRLIPERWRRKLLSILPPGSGLSRYPSKAQDCISNSLRMLFVVTLELLGNRSDTVLEQTTFNSRLICGDPKVLAPERGIQNINVLLQINADRCL